MDDCSVNNKGVKTGRRMSLLSLVPQRDSLLEMADIIPTMLGLINLKGEYLYANKAYLKFLNMSFDDLVGSRLKAVRKIEGISDDDRVNIIREVYETNTPSSNNYRVTLQNGLEHIIHVEMVPNVGRQSVFLFIRDMTPEYKSAHNEARFQALFDTAIDAILVMDETGTIESINRAGELAFGYEIDEIIGKNISFLLPDCDENCHQQYLNNFENLKVAEDVGRDVEGVRKNGSRFPCELSVAEFNSDGKLYYTGILRDVTVKKNHLRAMNEFSADLERELVRRQRTFDQIFTMSNDILALMSYDGDIMSVSPSVENVAGIAVDEMLSTPFDELAAKEDRAALRKLLNDVQKSGETIYSHEFRIVNRESKSTRWTAWSLKPVPEDRIIVLIGRDITREKQREEALRQAQKMEAIGQLTGGISHDFNNILMGISGSLDMMRINHEKDPAAFQRYLDAAMLSCKKAASLTERLLAFSRRQPLAPRPINPNELIESLEVLLTRTIGPNMELDFDLVPDAATIYCDTNQLENSIINLAINARDAMTDTGTVEIRSRNLTRKECKRLGIPPNEYVAISVKDSGCGMDDATRERVFEPFFTTKPLGKGTGLGLSMLYGFVMQSGGHVLLESAVNLGTTVTICLPKSKKKSGPVVDETSTVTATAPKRAGNRRILLVEDEDVIREMVKEVLEQNGYDVWACGDGTAALAEISDSTSRIDLVVSDVGLPGLNGKQIAEMGRVVRPELRTLFITGYAAGVTLRNDWLEEGMDMILKPFKMDALLAKVEEMIGD